MDWINISMSALVALPWVSEVIASWFFILSMTMGSPVLVTGSRPALTYVMVSMMTPLGLYLLRFRIN
jgi:hypothetical protein